MSKKIHSDGTMLGRQPCSSFKNASSFTVEALENRRLFAAVALFMNGSYVDLDTNAATGTAVNLREQLADGGINTVTTFTGITATALKSALANKDVLVLPSLIKGDLLAGLNNSAKQVIRDFLSNGGGLVSTGDFGHRNINFIADTFALGDITTFDDSPDDDLTKEAATAGTPFEDGPDKLTKVLNRNGKHYSFYSTAQALPAGSVVAYEQEFHAGGGVILLPKYSRLPIAIVSWDWANGGPDGAQDGGWNTTLQNTIEAVAREPVPGSISGAVFNDANRDAFRQNAEAGLGGRTVYLDANNDGIRQTSETKVTTAANGTFIFADVQPGTYYLRQVLPSGWIATVPASNQPVVVNLTSGAAATGKELGAYRVPAVELAGRVLRVNGTASNDNIFIELADNKVAVTFNGVVYNTYAAADVDSIFADGGAGDDRIVTAETFSKRVAITGAGGNDTLIGGAADDELSGANGKDRVYGMGGADYLLGGASGDRLFGGTGADTLSGAGGIDYLLGEAGANYLIGGNGNDRLYAAGNNAVDTLSGNAGTDYADADEDDLLSSIEGSL